MTAKRSNPSRKVSRVFQNRDETDAAITLLRRRIKELEDLRSRPFSYSEAEALGNNVVDTLRDILNVDSPEFERYEHWSLGPSFFTADTDLTPEYRKGCERTIHELERLITRLQEKAESLPARPTATATQHPITAMNREKSKRVFIVHGHNDTLKEQVSRLVERQGLEAVVLHEQANEGRTIIEKLENQSEEIGFAIILLTPDDVGYAAGHEADKKPRARQNVILELGYFIGKIGRRNVCCLNAEVELPSDYHGVLYILVDQHGSWKYTLANEMKQAGYTEIDLNKIK